MTPAQADELDQLREENRQLRALLVPPVSAPPEWHLTPRETRMWAHMNSRPLSTRESLMFAISEGREMEPQNLNVGLHHLRKKLAKHGVRVVNQWGHGWRLEHD